MEDDGRSMDQIAKKLRNVTIDDRNKETVPTTPVSSSRRPRRDPFKDVTPSQQKETSPKVIRKLFDMPDGMPSAVPVNEDPKPVQGEWSWDQPAPLEHAKRYTGRTDPYTTQDFRSNSCIAGSYAYPERFKEDQNVKIKSIAENPDDFLRAIGLPLEVRPSFEVLEAWLHGSFGRAREPVAEVPKDARFPLVNRLETLLRSLRLTDSQLRQLFKDNDAPTLLKEFAYEVYPDAVKRLIASDGELSEWKYHENKSMTAKAKRGEGKTLHWKTLDLPTVGQPTLHRVRLEGSGTDGTWISIPARYEGALSVADGDRLVASADMRRLIMIPSYRRSLRCRFFYDEHKGFDATRDVVILVCRAFEFDKYQDTVGRYVAVMALPELCVGVGFARAACVRIAHMLGQDKAFLVDDDLPNVYHQTEKVAMSFITACERMEGHMAGKERFVAVVGGTKTQFKTNLECCCKTPQCFVLVNVALLMQARLNYDPRLRRCEDFVLCAQLNARGYIVLTDPILRLRPPNRKDQSPGGCTSPVSEGKCQG